MYPSPAQPAFGCFVAAQREALERRGVEFLANVSTERPGQGSRRAIVKNLGLLRRAVALRPATYDMIHAHYLFPAGLIGVVTGALREKPVVVTVHGSDVLRPGGWLRRRLSRMVLQRADAVIAVSQSTAAAALRLSSRSALPLQIIPTGVDLSHFRPAVATHRSGETLRILGVGNLVPEKGFDVLLDAVAALPADARVEVQIIGDGRESTPLKRRAARLGLDRARFDGVVPPSRMPEAFRSADIVVVPSRSEGLGQVAIEASACGVPVVATRVGGLPEVVHDGTSGLLVPPNDARALSAALARLHRDPALLAKLGANGPKSVAEFDLDVLAARVARLYDTLVSVARP